MGRLSPKYKTTLPKPNKHMARAPKGRKENTRSKIVRFLIICEGTQTEPKYFEGLINDNYSEVREEEIYGEGMSTCRLVERAKEVREELEKVRQLGFDHVWVVFDKDDFDDFNEAIALAKKYGFECAWSNEAFELWYYLHFQFLTAGLSRRDYIDMLEREVRKNPGYENYKYCKNDPSMYRILQAIGDEELAKKRAKDLREGFTGCDYKRHNPCTRVDLLVEALENPML